MLGGMEHYVGDLGRWKVQDQKALWVTSFFRQLAFALLNVYSIVFVFEFGQREFVGGGIRGGLLLLLLYLLIIRLVTSMGIIPVAEVVIRRIGFRRSIWAGLMLHALATVTLAIASWSNEVALILVAAVLFGLMICTYWVSYFTMFSDGVSEGAMGKSFGTLDALAKLGQVVAPLIGAVVVLGFGYGQLFVWGAGFFLLAGVPMLFLEKHVHVDNVSWEEFVKWSSERTFFRAGVAMGGRLLQDSMYEDLWTVYVFILVGGLAGLGVFRSLVMLVAVVMSYVIGTMIDRGHGKRFQAVGVAGGVGLWLIRSVIKTVPQLFLIESLDRFFSTAARNYFFTTAFRRAKGPETFSFVVYWILWQSMWMVWGYVGLIGLVALGDVQTFWIGVIALGSWGLLASMLIQEHHQKSSRVSGLAMESGIS